MTPASSIISVNDVSHAYKEPGRQTFLALDHVNLHIHPGEFFVLVGPSGCGKSTLLRLMSGLEKPTHGTITWAADLTKKKMSFVFQNFALFPWMTVEENIALGLTARGTPEEEQSKIVQSELKRFGLTRFAKHHPRELSGGMQQRVGIARAFATNPEVLFMDEAFSELDTFTAEELRQELLGIWQERKTTIVMVTHIVQEAVELADRIAVMATRPGTIATIHQNPLPRPRNKRSHDFFAMEDAVTKLIRPV